MASTADPAGRRPAKRAREPGLDEAKAAGRDRDLREDLGGAEGEQHETGARVRADGGQRGEQRRVVERPAAAGRRQRALPARPERADDPRALAQQALRQPAQGLGAAAEPVAERWTTRPTQASGASKAIRTMPMANSATRTTRPMSVGSSRLRLTPPRRIAGIARTGIARTTAKTNRLAAVRPATARLAGRPAWTSMRYWSAAPSAPPPGATLASALPASCELTTARNAGPRMDRYWSAHRHARASVCSPASRPATPRPGRRGRPTSQKRRPGSAQRGRARRRSPRARTRCGEAPLRGGLGGLAALDLVLRVRTLVDRALEPVADLGHRRTSLRERAGER